MKCFAALLLLSSCSPAAQTETVNGSNVTPISAALPTSNAPRGSVMYEEVRPYLIRSGYSFVVARITEAKAEVAKRDAASDEPAFLTTLTLDVQTTWYGAARARLRVVLDEPVSEIARLRTPHPYWASTPRVVGTSVLLWFAPPENAGAAELDISKQPFGVTVFQEGPELGEVRDLLQKEALGEDVAARKSRYIGYLGSNVVPVKSFAIDALGKDDLGPDADARVAGALANALRKLEPASLRIELALVMAEHPYQVSSKSGRTAIVGALVLAAGDANADVQRAALDALSGLEPVDLDDLPAIRSERAYDAIEERSMEEAAAEKARLQKLLGKVRR
jgi:hypothetical protein